jgi:hypothetical protein
VETERLQDHEHATEATRGTRTLKEASNLSTARPRLPASTFHDVQNNIGTFCAFVHGLFGSKCDYYTKLINAKQIFDDPSTQSIQDAFTVPVCRRIIWAIVCDGCFCFSKVKLSQDLIPGVGWKDHPTSFLNLILNKVMFAEQIIHPTFPLEWETVVESPLTSNGYNEQRGPIPCFGDRLQSHGGVNQGEGKGRQYPHGNQYQKSWTSGNQYQQQGRGNPQTWTSMRDACHPKIKALINPLLAKDIQISVKAICQASNFPMYNLPGLAKYCNSTGRSTICWNNLIKGCGWTKCPLKQIGGHIPQEDLTDGFIDAVCNKLGKGVTYLIHNHRSPYESPPLKKAKASPPTATDLTGGEGQE